jgi:hypothetical protein
MVSGDTRQHCHPVQGPRLWPRIPSQQRSARWTRPLHLHPQWIQVSPLTHSAMLISGDSLLFSTVAPCRAHGSGRESRRSHRHGGRLDGPASFTCARGVLRSVTPLSLPCCPSSLCESWCLRVLLPSWILRVLMPSSSLRFLVPSWRLRVFMPSWRLRVLVSSLRICAS